jgi:FlaA1/EpsC-like NDP-sugar epimerase
MSQSRIIEYRRRAGMDVGAITSRVRFRFRRVMDDYRRLPLNVFQLAIVMASSYAAFSLRFDGDIPPEQRAIFVNTILWLVAIRAAAFAPFRLFAGLWQYADPFEFCNIVAAVGVSTGAFYVIVDLILRLSYSRSVLIIDSVLLVLGLCGVRLLPRVARSLRRKRGYKRIIIYGAGDAGEMIVRDMRGCQHGYEPLGFVDDDLAKLGQRIHGVPVLGDHAALPRIIAATEPHEVLVAMPSAPHSTIQAIVSSLQPFKIPITTLPSLRDIMDGRVAVNQIRDLTIADLLPRAPIDLDPQVIERLISGRRVLVTGAGGSIGAELSRQIAAANPSSLVLFERYENSLHELTNELLDRCSTLHVRPVPVIGDITDFGRVNQVMSDHRPELVFHAAAHKHVPLMEHHPCEAVKNNVVGTMTLVEAADHWNVERFILISTDKAVNPSSVMGATKHVAELIVQEMSTQSTTRFATVRFGNVLGSNGSVLLRFLAQIKAGGPVTVTHPDMRRYFMLIPEAVQLVLHAGALGESGMTYVLDMGEQIKLIDLARSVIRLAGCVPDRDIKIRFVGLRPGEKLYEELVGASETVEATQVPRINRLSRDSAIDPQFGTFHVPELIRLAMAGASAGVIEQLRVMVPSFEPGLEVSEVEAMGATTHPAIPETSVARLQTATGS